MLEEMKKDLEREFSEICDYNNDCENYRKVLKDNTNDSKFIKTGIIGMLSIIPIMTSLGVIAPLLQG